MVNYPGRKLGLLAICIGLLVVCMLSLLAPSEAEQGRKIIRLRTFQMRGAPETSAYEEGLYKEYTGWEMSVMPRKDFLDSAMPKKEIPARYIDETQQGMLKVIESSLLPGNINDLDWRGLPKKTPHDWDEIVTHYTKPSQKAQVLISGQAYHLMITVSSDALFPDEVATLTDDIIIKAAAKVLKIPAGKLPKFTVGKRTTVIANTPVCRGELTCEYVEGKSSYKDREWWSFLAFLYVKGKLTISVDTYDFKNQSLPASALDLWSLKKTEPAKVRQ